MKPMRVVCKTLLAATGVLAAGFASRQASAQTTANAVSVGQITVPARITEAIDESKIRALKGNLHPLARPEFDRGLVSDAQPMQRMLLLLERSPQQEAALRQLLEEQQTKDSPNFHKWLTPLQFGQQFGPADADIGTVVSWLESQGFSNIKVGAGRVVIEFSGNVGQVRNAFHTEIHKFFVNEHDRQANVSNPQIPAALSPVVTGIVSLNNFPRKSMRHRVGTFTRTQEGRVLPQFTGSTNQFFAVGPADFAKIYNLPSGLNGAGGKIAIIGTSDIDLTDVADFRSLFGLPASPPNRVLNGANPGIQPQGEESEADLDVEWSGAVAPGATIDFIISEDTLTASGVDLGAVYVIDNNADDIMSLSFGSCEANLGTAGNAFYSNLFEQAAAQGITVAVSAGDNGSAGCDDFNSASTATGGLAVSGISGTPFNISVGGTDFDDVGNQAAFWNENPPPPATPTANAPGTWLSVKGYIPEVPWNDSCAATATSSNLSTVCATPASSLLNIVAAAGGPSNCSTSTIVGTTVTCNSGTPKPSYQNGITKSDGVRDQPDVSLFASDGPESDSFYVVCEADALPAGSSPSCAPDSNGKFSFEGVGGTSAAAPSFAGILALIGQSEASAGRSRRQGNANFTLYKIAGTPGQSCNSSNEGLTGSTCAFNDVTKNTIAVPCAGKSTNCSSTTTSNGVLVDPAHATTPAWTAATGYDYATGLGSVNVANLVAAWGSAAGTLKVPAVSLTVNGGTAVVAINHGTTVNTAVAVSGAGGTPSGEVSLIAATAPTNGVSPNSGVAGTSLSGGAANINGVVLPGGSYNLTAHYSGDGTFGPNDSNGVPIVVQKEASHLLAGIVTFSSTGSISSTSATTFAYGSPYILRMDILNSGGTPANCQPLSSSGPKSGCALDATGNVTVTDNGSPLDQGSFPINSAGHTEDQPIQLPAGSHTVVATYSGDVSYNAAPAVTLNLTVSKAATSVTVSASPASIPASPATSVTLTAIVDTQSNGAAPGGTVQFLNGTTPISGTVILTPSDATATTSASLKATLTTTLSALGLPERPAPRWPRPPLAPVVLLLITAAILVCAARRSQRQRLAYVYTGLVILAAGLLLMDGCGGSSSSTTQSKTITISAQYSGDSNYASSSGKTSVAVQ